MSNVDLRVRSALELLKPYGTNGVMRNKFIRLMMEKNACSYGQANFAVNQAIRRYSKQLRYEFDKRVITYFELDS